MLWSCLDRSPFVKACFLRGCVFNFHAQNYMLYFFLKELLFKLLNTIVSFSKRFLRSRLDRVRFGTKKSRLREFRNS